MKLLRNVSGGLDRAAKMVGTVTEVSVVLALGATLVLLLFTVFSRYFFRLSAPWVPEMVSYSMAYIAAFGFSCLVQRRSLLAITFLRDRLSARGSIVFDMVISVGLILYFRLFITHGITFAQNVRGQLTPSGMFDMSHPRMILVGGAVLIVFQAINNLLQDATRLIEVVGGAIGHRETDVESR